MFYTKVTAYLVTIIWKRQVKYERIHQTSYFVLRVVGDYRLQLSPPAIKTGPHSQTDWWYGNQRIRKSSIEGLGPGLHETSKFKTHPPGPLPFEEEKGDFFRS